MLIPKMNTSHVFFWHPGIFLPIIMSREYARMLVSVEDQLLKDWIMSFLKNVEFCYNRKLI